MREPCMDLAEVKKQIMELKGRDIEMAVNHGRKKITHYQGVIEDIYNSVFVVRLQNNAKTEKENAKNKLMEAEKSIEHIDEEIKQKLSEASIKGDDIAKQILANTNEKVDLIEKNISRVISAEEKTLSAKMTQKTLDASIELAKQHIKSLLKDNIDLHNKFIDESIDSIDRV